MLSNKQLIIICYIETIQNALNISYEDILKNEKLWKGLKGNLNEML